jgi:hypothetical protein
LETLGRLENTDTRTLTEGAGVPSTRPFDSPSTGLRTRLRTALRTGVGAACGATVPPPLELRKGRTGPSTPLRTGKAGS